MDKRTFAKFHLDVRIGDAIMQSLEVIACKYWVAFAGIEASRVRAIPREQQFAEKIHAYTLPRSSTNSRVKDLVDMALLIGSGGMDRSRIREALSITFDRRGTHPLPTALLRPPPAWQHPFQALAVECNLPAEITTVFSVVESFFENLLP